MPDPIGTPTADALSTPPPATPTTQSAVHAAVAGRTSDYRTARRAERAGTPLPEVAIKAEAPAAPADGPAADPPAPPAAIVAPENRKTRADKEQARINETIRTATDAATASLKAEIARLQAQIASRPTETARPAATPASAAPPEKQEPAYKRYLALPDAPKLAQFDSVEEHAAAMAVFIDDTRTAERAAADRQRSERASLSEAQTARVDSFVTRLTETKAADPAFVSKLSPEVIALKPFGALAPGEGGGPLNVVAEQIFDSPIAPAVMLHFSTASGAQDLARLAAMPADILKLPAAQRVRAHTTWIVREFAKIEGRLEAAAITPEKPAPPPNKVITDAPAAPAALGSRPNDAADPKAAAVKRGDTRAYRQIRQQERRAALGR